MMLCGHQCRFVGALLVLVAASGCAPRGVLTFAPEAADVGSVEPIFVATTRGIDGGPNFFTGARSERLTFGRFEIAVPPVREAGTVTFPDGRPPNPQTDFLTVSARRLAGERNFVSTINAELAGSTGRSREAIVFMHGFNTNFSEGLYRHAQMAYDFKTPGVAVQYSWPSAGDVRLYVSDRESALFARDGLQTTLNALARTNVSRIVVVAHSMGALVLIETLRQMALEGSPGFFRKLQSVVLLSPDLDIDVFRTQLRPLVKKDVPIYVFYSVRDRALRVSSLIRGQSDRLGSIRDVSTVGDLPITLINTSDVEAVNDPLGHLVVATSPSMIALMQGFAKYGSDIIADDARNSNLFETSVNALTDATQVVLQPLVQ